MSTLLWLGCAAASVRAQWATDEFSVVPNQVYAVQVDWRRGPWRRRIGVEYQLRVPDRSAARINSGQADFSLPRIRWFPDRVYVAHWLISLLTLPLPVIALLRWVGRSRRYSEGFCVACGYDLRASVDRCPECGAVVAGGWAN